MSNVQAVTVEDLRECVADLAHALLMSVEDLWVAFDDGDLDGTNAKTQLENYLWLSPDVRP